jgi:hypothetical protein
MDGRDLAQLIAKEVGCILIVIGLLAFIIGSFVTWLVMRIAS